MHMHTTAVTTAAVPFTRHLKVYFAGLSTGRAGRACQTQLISLENTNSLICLFGIRSGSHLDQIVIDHQSSAILESR